MSEFERLKHEIESNFDGIDISLYYKIEAKYSTRCDLGGDEMFKLYRDGIEFQWYGDASNDFEPEPMTQEEEKKLEEHRAMKAIRSLERITDIFNSFFANEDKMWVIIHNYIEDNFNRISDEYFNKVINSIPFTSIDKSIVNIEVQGGIVGEEPEYTKLEITLASASNSENFIKLLEGMANYELGFKPAIQHKIYFLSSDSIFYMYDDRGADISSTESKKIELLEEQFKDIIMEY